jgi:hypothetical protein
MGRYDLNISSEFRNDCINNVENMRGQKPLNPIISQTARWDIFFFAE